jgi:chemotaxis protein methyltransferase CheR
MSAVAPEKVLTQFGKNVAERFGIHLKPSALSEIPKKLQPLKSKLGFRDDEECLNWLASNQFDRVQKEALIDWLTVPETYFFRDAAMWNYLSDRLLPYLRDRGTGMNVWSAGCCTGEEPYTLAMAVDSLAGGSYLRPVKIIGTDLNVVSLDRARSGQFRPWSLRTTPAPVIDKYFHPADDNEYKLAHKIRNLVSFEEFNLVDLLRGIAPPMVPKNGFDVIFCRNVLIYFESTNAARIIEELHKYLADDGVLFLTPCDVDLASRALYEVMLEPGLLVLRKKRRVSGSNPHDTVPPRLRNFDVPVEIPSKRQANERTVPAKSGAPAPLPVIAPPAAMPLASKAAPLPLPQTPPSVAAQIVTAQQAEGLVKRGASEQAVDALKELLNRGKFLPQDQPAIPHCEFAPDVEYYLILLHGLSNLGRTEEALQWVDRSLTTFPLHEVLYFWRAALLQQSGRDEEAVRSLQQAIFVDAGFVMAHFSLFMLLNKLGRQTDADVYRRNTQRLLEMVSRDEKLPCAEELNVRQIESIIRSLAGENGGKSTR